MINNYCRPKFISVFSGATRITYLKRLIFGKGDKTTKQEDKSPKAEVNNADAEESETSPSNDEGHEPKESTGHGRLAHTAYINAQEHTIALESLSVGQLCPHHCGGRLYSINPGILINIKGQNLASVNKYWIEKLRCALCNEIFQPKFQLMSTRKNIIQILKQC